MNIDVIRKKREDILRLSAARGAYDVRIFGSTVQGGDRPDSDVDFLVELRAGRSLLDLSGLRQDLIRLLDVDVDVVTPKALHWYIRERVLKEAVPL